MTTPLTLSWPAIIGCHEPERAALSDRWRARFDRPAPPPLWDHRPDGIVRCTWCGSITPQALHDTFADRAPQPHPLDPPICPHHADGFAGHTLLSELYACQKAVNDRAMAWAGMAVADWKYGWPHKIYCTMPGLRTAKFLAVHLLDLDAPTFDATAQVISRHTGILYDRDEAGMLVYTTALPGA